MELLAASRVFAVLLRALANVIAAASVRNFDAALTEHLLATRRIRQRLSPFFVEALVVAEDRRFFAHSGVDARAVLRAIVRTIFARKREGGSTIEQQLVRTITNSRAPTLRRKLREWVLASHLAACVSKEDTARLYLSVAYFGARMNGLSAACRRLGISERSPTLRQACDMIARIRYPEPSGGSLARQALQTRRSAYIFANVLHRAYRHTRHQSRVPDEAILAVASRDVPR